MKEIQKSWIKLKENIDKEDYDLINNLQEQCFNADKTSLKLALDYKLAGTSESDNNTSINNINEFMYFNRQQIIEKSPPSI